MKLLALVTPAAMLLVLWALQRLERWMVEPAPAHRRRRHPRSAALVAPGRRAAPGARPRG